MKLQAGKSIAWSRRNTVAQARQGKNRLCGPISMLRLRSLTRIVSATVAELAMIQLLLLAVSAKLLPELFVSVV